MEKEQREMRATQWKEPECSKESLLKASVVGTNTLLSHHDSLYRDGRDGSNDTTLGHKQGPTQPSSLPC